MSGSEYLHQTRSGSVACPVWAHRFSPDVYEMLGGWTGQTRSRSVSRTTPLSGTQPVNSRSRWSGL